MSDEQWFVDGCEKLLKKSPAEILNWYRNLYYQEPHNTEHGIMARAINNCSALLNGDAQPVVHGRWELIGTAIGIKTYRCGRCKGDEYWKTRFNYGNESFCPNCGAKMDLEC